MLFFIVRDKVALQFSPKIIFQMAYRIILGGPFGLA
jgi:hypothetical protein